MAEGEQAPPPYVDVATYSTVESSSPYPEATQQQQTQSYPHVQQPVRPQAKHIILALPVRSPEEIAAKKAERDRLRKQDTRNTWICFGVCGVIILLACILIFVLISVGNSSGNYTPLYVLLAIVFTFCVVCGCCGKQEDRSCLGGGAGVCALACLVGNAK